MKTPTLFYSEKRILSQARNLKSAAAKSHVKLVFPVKSFAHRHFLKLISPFVDAFAVNSAQEEKLLRGLHKDITFYQPGSSHPPSRKKHYSAFTTDTLSKLDDARLFLRLDVSQVDRSQKTRFGISFSDFSQSKCRQLHLHVNDPDISVQALIRFHKKLWQECKKRKIELKALNIGGGFQTFSQKDLLQFFSSLRKMWGKKVELIAEPGRYFTFGAGYAKAEILSVSAGKISTSFSFELHGRGSFKLGLFVPPGQGKKIPLQVMGPTAFEEDTQTFYVSSKTQFYPGETLIIAGLSGYSVSWNHSLQGIPKAKIEFMS